MIRLVVATIFWLLVIAGLALVMRPRTLSHGTLYDDTRNAKAMILTLWDDGTYPACRDGRVDVYRVMFEDRELDVDSVADLFNNAAGSGPTIEQVEARDYSAFAWGRAWAADARVAGKRVPVLWSEAPTDGHRVVGFSDGAALVLTEEEFAALWR